LYILYSIHNFQSDFETLTPSYTMGIGAYFQGIKQLGYQADHSAPSDTKIGNGGAVPPFPHMVSWCCT
jgi:hypothetical protein